MNNYVGYGDHAQVLEPVSLAIDPLPVTLDIDMGLIREHCHIDDSSRWDDPVNVYVRSAILWAEHTMHRTIVARNHRWVLECFPIWRNQGIRLPRGKTQSVTSLVYSQNYQNVTLTGPSASPPGTGFTQDLSSEDGGFVYPLPGTVWPYSDYDVPNPVVINFVAGYPSFTLVPPDIYLALMFYVSDCFEARGTADIDKTTYLDIRHEKLSSYILNRTYK